MSEPVVVMTKGMREAALYKLVERLMKKVFVRDGETCVDCVSCGRLLMNSAALEQMREFHEGEQFARCDFCGQCHVVVMNLPSNSEIKLKKNNKVVQMPDGRGERKGRENRSYNNGHNCRRQRRTFFSCRH
jgi:hypothetical protein